eukprot:scaffold3924_cov109-Cylindrotheca_fusiformis.AAC.15
MRIRRRRNPSSVYIFTLALMACRATDAFGFRSLSRRLRPNRNVNIRDSERFSNNVENNLDSWSKSASDRKSGPFQVRKRVKEVLQKARTRTGVENSSDTSIGGEAASIGGLSDDFRIELEPQSRNGTQQDRNGSSSKSVMANRTEVQNTNGQVVSSEIISNRKPNEFDAIQRDIPAANTVCDPRPFKLPILTEAQKRQLRSGERVQEQARMGREGSGHVVLDVKAPPYVVWECLLDFESYPQTIPTVRDMELYASEKLGTSAGDVDEKAAQDGTGRGTRRYGTPSVTRAKFVLSKFRLNIAAIHTYTPHPDGDYMIFTLDKSCTNMVLKGAKGIWYTEENPDGREVSFGAALPLLKAYGDVRYSNFFAVTAGIY